MPEIPVVHCPHCEKKFKPKSDVSGKKIKCPFCTKPFQVPAAKDSKKDAKPSKSADAKTKPDASKPTAPASAGQSPAEEKKFTEEDLETDANPYGVKNQDLTLRCPHCAKPMVNEDAIICIHCGYNTLTRQAGSTTKTLGITFGQHLKYLAPALGAAAFTFGAIIFLLYYAVVSPFHVHNTFMSFTDHESLRMWTTAIVLGWIWGAGLFCFKKFIEQPKPDEIKID